MANEGTGGWPEKLSTADKNWVLMIVRQTLKSCGPLSTDQVYEYVAGAKMPHAILSLEPTERYVSVQLALVEVGAKELWVLK